MKCSEIKIGHIYSNNKSGWAEIQKEVLDIWYTYNGKKIKYLQYQTVYANSEVQTCKPKTILYSSFAQWAKKDIT